jgi:adenylate cyclase
MKYIPDFFCKVSSIVSSDLYILAMFLLNMLSGRSNEKSKRRNWVHYRLLKEERNKVDALLEGLLPANILQQLQQGRQLFADEFEEVSLLISDIVGKLAKHSDTNKAVLTLMLGFTEMSCRCSPSDVVEFLNDLYSNFDHIAENLKIQKIATIGNTSHCKLLQ